MSMEIDSSQTHVAVVGLGYVGLPTALAFHQAGFHVRGIDVSQRAIESIQSGKPPFVDEGVVFSIPMGDPRWAVSADFSSVIPHSDIVLITVPTPVNADKTPDLSYVRSASRSVMEAIDPERGTIVVLESTVYPGVTRKELGRICSDLGIEIGKQVRIAYSPERINPGDPLHSASSVDRIVGCDDSEIGQYLAEVYSNITSANSSYVGPIEVAEAAKLVENVQRDIDIAFVNELATVLPRMGIDVEQVLSAAATKWNFHRHTPGIGVGGHCIPVDPYYYSSLAEDLGSPSMISPIARRINEGMPIFAADSILNILSDEEKPRVLLLGFAYKENTGDIRETPVTDLSRALSDSGCQVFVWDPHVGESSLPIWVSPVEEPGSVSEIDLVVVSTAHDECLKIDWDLFSEVCPSKKVFDGRRCLSPQDLSSKGWKYFGIGFPGPN